MGKSKKVDKVEIPEIPNKDIRDMIVHSFFTKEEVAGQLNMPVEVLDGWLDGKLEVYQRGAIQLAIEDLKKSQGSKRTSRILDVMKDGAKKYSKLSDDNLTMLESFYSWDNSIRIVSRQMGVDERKLIEILLKKRPRSKDRWGLFEAIESQEEYLFRQFPKILEGFGTYSDELEIDQELKQISEEIDEI